MTFLVAAVLALSLSAGGTAWEDYVTRVAWLWIDEAWAATATDKHLHPATEDFGNGCSEDWRWKQDLYFEAFPDGLWICALYAAWDLWSLALSGLADMGLPQPPDNPCSLAWVKNPYVLQECPGRLIASFEPPPPPPPTEAEQCEASGGVWFKDPGGCGFPKENHRGG